MPTTVNPVPRHAVSATAAETGAYVDAIDGPRRVFVPEASRAQAFTPKTITKMDASANAVLVTDGASFTETITDQGDSLTIVSDGRAYTTTYTPGRVATSSLIDGDYGDVVVSGSGTAMAIDSAYTAAIHTYADGVGTAAQAASLPLHGTADDSAKVSGTTPTAYGLSLVDDADASTARTTLGLGTLATQSGTFSGTSSGTNTGDQTNISGNAATVTTNANLTGPITSVGNATAVADAELAAIAGLTSASDSLPYFTGSGTASLATFTAAGRALVDDADAAAQRTTLGLGTLATQSGTFSGTSSGSNTGDQSTVSGNAGTATALQTARAINGVNFDGTGPITVTAAGSTLTGTTIASGMLGSTSSTACAGNDSRLSDSRAPNGTAGGDLAGSYPNPTVKASVSLTTPVIGVATGTSLAATGALSSSSASAGIGYAAGAGTAVTQGAGSGKATGVTLNTMCGQITMNNAALAAAAEISFTVTCSSVLIQDVIVCCHQSAGTFGAYAVHAGGITNATSFKIFVGNMSTGSLSEAIVLNFVIIRGVKA